MPRRLLLLYRALGRLIAEHRPAEAAVERLFFGRNTTTAISVGQARGVVLLALAEAGVPVAEYTPAEVKQALAGFGRAQKAQMQRMTQALLDLPQMPHPDDAADALAIAICHLRLGRAARRRAALAVAGVADDRLPAGHPRSRRAGLRRDRRGGRRAAHPDPRLHGHPPAGARGGGAPVHLPQRAGGRPHPLRLRQRGRAAALRAAPGRPGPRPGQGPGPPLRVGRGHPAGGHRRGEHRRPAAHPRGRAPASPRRSCST